MSRTKARERHIFPAESHFHVPSQWCKCKPGKRANPSGTVYVHRDWTHEQEAALKKLEPTDDRPFTVILPGVLRERFERWLRNNHLQMDVVPQAGPVLYRVADSGGQRH
jgi:hypothetical protein